MKTLLLSFLFFTIQVHSQINISSNGSQKFLKALSYQERYNMSTEGFDSFYSIENSKMNFSEKLKKLKIEFIEYHQFGENQEKTSLFSKGKNLRKPKFYKHTIEFKNQISSNKINFKLKYFYNNFQYKLTI